VLTVGRLAFARLAVVLRARLVSKFVGFFAVGLRKVGARFGFGGLRVVCRLGKERKYVLLAALGADNVGSGRRACFLLCERPGIVCARRLFASAGGALIWDLVASSAAAGCSAA
jgi:hypothetical protein